MPVFAALVTAVPAPGAVSLPPEIHATLDQEYPGWKLAPVTAQIQQEFKKHRPGRNPSLAVGDFNRDGQPDYAVQIALTQPGEEEQIVIIFIASANGYQENIVQSMGLDQTTYLWTSKKAVAETGANAQDKMTKKDVLMVLGGPLNETTYGYQDGKFEEIRTPMEPRDEDPANITQAEGL